MNKLSRTLAAAAIGTMAYAMTPDDMGKIETSAGEYGYNLYEGADTTTLDIAHSPAFTAYLRLRVDDRCKILDAETHPISRGTTPIPHAVTDQDREKLLAVAVDTNGRLLDACL